MDYNSTKNQDIKRKFVDREVYYCVSLLVSELAQKAESFPDYYDDLLDAYRGLPDYEEAALQEGWKKAQDGRYYKEDANQYYLSVNLNERGLINVSVHHVTEPGQGPNGKEVWSYDGTYDESVDLDGSEELDITDAYTMIDYLIDIKAIPEGGELYEDEDCSFEVSDADDWEELCNEESIDADEYAPEILEHWLVSDWLADKLEAHGERVLKDFFGLTVWGRTTSGQAILLDGVISEICAEMEILEGQKNEWKV